MEQDKEILESDIERFLESRKGKIIEYMESKIGGYDNILSHGIYRYSMKGTLDFSITLHY